MDSATESSPGDALIGQSQPANGDPSAQNAIPALRLILKPNGPVLEVTRTDAIVGRHSTADVRLTLPDISRRHCRLLHSQDGWQIFDLDSLNGVFLNGHKVSVATLHDGDVLGIGGFAFIVEVEPSTWSKLHPSAQRTPVNPSAPDDTTEAVSLPMQRPRPQRKAS